MKCIIQLALIKQSAILLIQHAFSFSFYLFLYSLINELGIVSVICGIATRNVMVLLYFWENWPRNWTEIVMGISSRIVWFLTN
jgi:hypothetical protein